MSLPASGLSEIKMRSEIRALTCTVYSAIVGRKTRNLIAVCMQASMGYDGHGVIRYNKYYGD